MTKNKLKLPNKATIVKKTSAKKPVTKNKKKPLKVLAKTPNPVKAKFPPKKAVAKKTIVKKSVLSNHTALKKSTKKLITSLKNKKEVTVHHSPVKVTSKNDKKGTIALSLLINVGTLFLMMLLSWGAESNESRFQFLGEPLQQEQDISTYIFSMVTCITIGWVCIVNNKQGWGIIFQLLAAIAVIIGLSSIQ